MFNCHKCKQTQPPRTSPVRVVLQTKIMNHTNRVHITDGRGQLQWRTFTGQGPQIVKEVDYCRNCAIHWGIEYLEKHGMPVRGMENLGSEHKVTEISSSFVHPDPIEADPEIDPCDFMEDEF